jgi:hypothetical protein
VLFQAPLFFSFSRLYTKVGTINTSCIYNSRTIRYTISRFSRSPFFDLSLFPRLSLFLFVVYFFNLICHDSLLLHRNGFIDSFGTLLLFCWTALEGYIANVNPDGFIYGRSPFSFFFFVSTRSFSYPNLFFTRITSISRNRNEPVK